MCERVFEQVYLEQVSMKRRMGQTQTNAGALRFCYFDYNEWLKPIIIVDSKANVTGIYYSIITPLRPYSL